MIIVKSVRLGMLLRYIGRPLMVLFAFDVAIVAAYVFGGWKWLALPGVPLSIFGGVLGVIVSFRNTSAYARWWEARTIWGAIVNNSRSFAREALSMIGVPETCRGHEREIADVKRRLILLQIAYVTSLRNHL